MIERALGAELTEHPGVREGGLAGRGSGNSRDGTTSMTILIEDGEIEILSLATRAGSFEPQLIAKGPCVCVARESGICMFERTFGTSSVATPRVVAFVPFRRREQ